MHKKIRLSGSLIKINNRPPVPQGLRDKATLWLPKFLVKVLKLGLLSYGNKIKSNRIIDGLFFLIKKSLKIVDFRH